MDLPRKPQISEEVGVSQRDKDLCSTLASNLAGKVFSLDGCSWVAQWNRFLNKTVASNAALE